MPQHYKVVAYLSAGRTRITGVAGRSRAEAMRHARRWAHDLGALHFTLEG